MSLKLFAAPMSSATPVVCALAELDLDCEIVMLDLQAGEQKRPAYLAINPHGVVPTLVVDGTPLFETVEILQWLGETYGVERGLWPAAGTPERLTALSWSGWIYASYGALVGTLNFARSPHVDAALHHPPLAAEVLRRLDAALGRLDARLAARPFLLGDAYSLADLTVACVVTYSLYCGVSVEGHPHVRDWLRGFYTRPAYARGWGDAPPMV
ncbi:glutathione S-transferase family protein [Luteimonas sp. BDR2-5]|uniref:glutathione S-transferase family protein n=1 Tax=Proluteimonas luteida TaxID=2878685 RepID=UPI001E4EB445|nr:glutathione S-transferase family protein [Luteimonas sp. BDR2-5]MCD9027558.1 glutathione S-transferase family protein [Luteimonas sp. BDR2-5]